MWVATAEPARITLERLSVPGYTHDLFNTHRDGARIGADERMINAEVYQPARGRNPTFDFLRDRPLLVQVAQDRRVQPAVRELVESVRTTLASMRFLDLSPEAMRLPSVPGQMVLSDRGENLSSVLETLCQDPLRKDVLVQWVQALTPMDVVDLDFDHDLTGRTLVTLVEEGGGRTTAYSASDGTLRFLAMATALLSPEAARFYFFEELDNGIHPTRVALLLQLIEQQVSSGKLQVVATTHSPSLLRLLNPSMREFATLVYRSEEQEDARVKRVLDIPEAKRILENRDLGRLFEAGWMETSIAFAEDEAEEAAA